MQQRRFCQFRRERAEPVLQIADDVGDIVHFSSGIVHGDFGSIECGGILDRFRLQITHDYRDFCSGCLALGESLIRQSCRDG